MKNEAQDNRTGTGRTGRRRIGRRERGIESGGIGAIGTIGGSTGRDGEPGPGRDRSASIHAAVGTMGTPPIEDRGEPGRYKREPAPVETAPKDPDSATADTGTGTGKTTTEAKSEGKALDNPKQKVSGETREAVIKSILADPTSYKIRTASRKFQLPRHVVASIWHTYQSSQKVDEPEFEIDENPPLSIPASQKFRPGGKKAKEQAEQTALTLLTILDGAIGMTLGPECVMTPDEHKMIDEPLARILARMAPETTELIDRWTDPLLLATGLIMWGARVFLVLSREVKREAGKRKTEPVKSEPAETSAGLDLNRPIQATGIPVEVAEALG